MHKTIMTKVLAVRFPREEEDRARREAGEKTLFYILSIDGEPSIAKGELTYRPTAGLVLSLRGEESAWQGQRQFRFASAEVAVPTDERQMLEYCCELTKGIGPAMAQKIWDVKGADWRTVKDGEVPRLTAELLAGLHSTLEELELRQTETRTICWLRSVGCTPNQAKAAWALWGPATVPKVKDNCYCLAELPHYGFRDVDLDIRRRFGIADDDQRRIDAAVRYAVSSLVEGGDTLVSWPRLAQELDTLLPSIPRTRFSDTVAAFFASGELVGFAASRTLCRARDFENELLIYQFASAK